MESRGQKVLVAIDETEESMHALSWCIHTFKSDTNITLVLLYVKPPPATHFSFDATGHIFSGDDVIAAMEKYSKESVNSVMGKAEAIYRTVNPSNQIKVERMVGSGDAKDVICSAVEKLEADTLVIGSHGYGFFKRALLGSVSEYCAKHAKCPVIIVKH